MTAKTKMLVAKKIIHTTNIYSYNILFHYYINNSQINNNSDECFRKISDSILKVVIKRNTDD